MPPRSSRISNSSNSSNDRAAALVSLSTLSDLLSHQTRTLLLPIAPTNAEVNGDIDDGSASLPTVLSDLHALLALLSKETTSLSLAFAPPKESWDAVLAVSNKVAELSGKILHALCLLSALSISSSSSGSSSSVGQMELEGLLAKEWRNGSHSVLLALKELIDICRKIYNQVPSGKAIAPQQRKQILTHTSLVWKSIERTEKLAKDEKEAFVNAWKSTLDLFDDALEETEAIAKREVKGKEKAKDEDSGAEQQDSDESDDEFDFDDDDDEPISPEELARTQSALRLMKLVRALWKKVPSTLSILPATSLTLLHSQAYTMISLQDDLASSLDPPQDSSDVLEITRKYQAQASSLIRAVIQLLNQRDTSLESSLDGLTLHSAEPRSQDGKQTAGIEEQKKWYAACETQIDKAAKALLNQSEMPIR